MNRLTNYCGQWIRHCGWYPDIKLRMFDRRLGAWCGVNPHDKYELKAGSEVKHLKGDLLHYSFYTIEQHKQQIEKFSQISAQAKLESGVRSSWAKIIAKSAAKFLKGYILKMGFLDGYFGWVICTQSAKASYLKYHKLLKLQQSRA